MRGWAFLVAAILGCGMVWGTSQAKSPANSKAKSPAKKSSKSKAKKSKSVPRATQPDGPRSRQIQAALKSRGYLNAEPSGKWDAATIAAFAKYQQDHGRKPTGKPDSKSLIELGLGAQYPPLSSDKLP